MGGAIPATLPARAASRARDSKDLPRWLAGKKDYDIWQRNNLWMMFNALAEGAKHLHAGRALQSRAGPDGPGGTAHLVAVASQVGFQSRWSSTPANC